MVAEPDFEAVIAGGGLAGLSLLGQLAAAGWRDRQVLLIDDGRQPIADRAWAYWSDAPGLFDAERGRAWSRVAVRAGGKDLRLPLRSERYRLLTGAELSVAVDKLTADMTGLTTMVGQVREVVGGSETATVVTDGPTCTARWVFDSVSRTPVATTVLLTFIGWRVRCSRPAFDPDQVTLFDFEVGEVGEVDRSRFVYLLPTSPFEALVECTCLTPAGQSPPVAAELAAELARYLGRDPRTADYQVLGTESGTLELGEAPERPDTGRILPIGISGGLLKPSTGYAFSRIQRDSAAIAASLQAHGDPFHRPPGRPRFRFLDKVFLETIRHDPELLGQVFAALFSANPPDRILRFLDEQSTPAEEARIVASLPPLPFLRSVGRLRR